MGITVVVLGSGCDRCRRLAAHGREALAEVGRGEVEVQEVHDSGVVAPTGVLLTPALVINGLVL